MKRVEVFLHPYQLDAVKDVLLGVGVQGVTVSEIKDFEHGHRHQGRYRGAESHVEYVPMVKLETVVRDDRLEPVVQAITAAMPAGSVIADRILVMPVEEAVRIRTGESGVRAIR